MAISIAVIPFFLFPGGYVSHDIPREIASATDKHPDAKVRCGKTLTEQPKLVSILAEQIPSDAIKAGGTVAIIVMAGGVAAENRETIERIRTEFHQHVGIDTRYGFVDRGGMIQLNRSGARVEFEINRATAEQARLKISPQLLKLAADVRGAGRGR